MSEVTVTRLQRIWQQKTMHSLLTLLRHYYYQDLPYPNVSNLLRCRTKVPEHATNCLYCVDSGEEEGISVERGFCYRRVVHNWYNVTLQLGGQTILLLPTYKEGSTSCRTQKYIFQILRGRPVGKGTKKAHPNTHAQ